MRYLMNPIWICLMLMLSGSGALADYPEIRLPEKISSSKQYRLDRFRGGPRTSGDTGTPHRLGSSKLMDPAVSPVQHEETAEIAPVPRSIRLAQSDFLDDLLSEEIPEGVEPDATPTDTAEPATEPAPNAEPLPSGVPPQPGPATVAPRTGVPMAPTGPPAFHEPSPALTHAHPITVVPPVPPRRPPVNQPYTLAGILDDDENNPADCMCEQAFCEQMWQCAGGRSMSWYRRMRRNLCRNVDVVWLGPGGPQNYRSNPMTNWQCPYRTQNQAEGGCPHCQEAGYAGSEWQFGSMGPDGGFPMEQPMPGQGAPMPMNGPEFPAW